MFGYYYMISYIFIIKILTWKSVTNIMSSEILKNNNQSLPLKSLPLYDYLLKQRYTII